jgi:hypothetical protein
VHHPDVVLHPVAGTVRISEIQVFELSSAFNPMFSGVALAQMSFEGPKVHVPSSQPALTS